MPGEGVHEQDVDGTLVVDQNTSNSAIDYLDFSDQGIVMWVEELVGFIVSKVLILVPTSTVCHERRGVPKQSLSGDLVYHVFSRGDQGSVLMEPSLRKGWGNIISDCPKQFFVLDSFSKSLYEGVILTCMMALSKRSRYPFKGSFSPCLILKKYKVSFFKVFTLRNTAKKASDNCLNESIVLVFHLLISVRGAIISGYGRFFKSSQVKLLVEVVQFILAVCLDLWWFVDRAIPA
ncbi:hypothetical protein TIFTF001_041544 [Ficus carica]|uniref:Uncharacterized protein n=1 Tax=Ficus carica TaxID=3494 RepID=A0AA88CTJ4_FICCA|nr:hypothetical protein TIFTF001_041544 [Ficus carica]